MKNIVDLPISSLVPYSRNSRTHSPEQIAKIASSIKEFGFVNPVLIDADRRIIAGHGRIEAAKKLGISTAPCLEVTGLSEAQIRAYIIADNKLAEQAGWDDDVLRLELSELSDIGFDLDLTGFSIDDLEPQEPPGKLRPVELSAPKMAWVLIGIPLVDFVEISPIVDSIALNQKAIVHTTVSDK